MPLPFSAPWDRITRIHPMHHPKSRDGNLTFQIGTRGGHPQEEEGHHRAPQDHPQEEVEEGVEAEVEEEVEAGGEHSHCPDTHLPNQLKSF